MARFILKFKLKGRPNRNRPDVEVESERVVLGSRPIADVYLNDRMVAQEALAFRFDGARLVVEVVDELAGVFLDGRSISTTATITDAATLQVGHALVEVQVDSAAGTCELTTSEGYLAAAVDSAVKKAKPDTPFALVDSGPQEHLWGRNPVLQRLVWLAVFGGVLALAAFPFLRNSEALSRGELALPHQIGHGDGSPQSCSDCHSPFSSDYGPKCAVCHEDYDSPLLHPYDDVTKTTCSTCHMDHRGANADMIPAAASEIDPETGWMRMCGDCHGVLDAVPDKPLRDKPGENVDRWLHVDGFAHSDHRLSADRSRVAATRVPPAEGDDRVNVPVDCSRCHLPTTEGGLQPSLESAEFALVSYEQCLECHAGWSVPIHGRDRGGEACFACHASASVDAITSALRDVDVPATTGMYEVRRRAHDYSSDDCASCHVRGTPAPATLSDSEPVPFRHDHHLSTVTPLTGTGLVFSEQCTPCHTDVRASDSLEGTSLVNYDMCIECHTAGAPTPVASDGSTRAVRDMIHSIHAPEAGSFARGATRSLAQTETLAAGCLACHVPVAGEQPMGLRDGTRDCTACHTRHANVGEGKCVLCHVDRGFEGNRTADGRLDFVFNEEGIFNRDKAVMNSKPVIEAFDHASSGHQNGACEDCHDTEAIDQSDRVSTVPWPRYDEKSCVECHAQRRFHR